LLSGGIYVVQQPNPENAEFIRYNRLTGALDLFNAGKPGADWGWVRMPNTVNLEIAERLKHVNTTEQPAQP
jgi:hypothetical protein